MIFYQVNLKNKKQTKTIYNNKKNEILVNKELLTNAELQKIKNKKYYNFDENDFKKIEHNKQKTYWLFGARFAINNESKNK